MKVCIFSSHMRLRAWLRCATVGAALHTVAYLCAYCLRAMKLVANGCAGDRAHGSTLYVSGAVLATIVYPVLRILAARCVDHCTCHAADMCAAQAYEWQHMLHLSSARLAVVHLPSPIPPLAPFTDVHQSVSHLRAAVCRFSACFLPHVHSCA